MSFMDLTFNFNKLLDGGYSKNFLDRSLHTLLTLPFFIVNDRYSLNFRNDIRRIETILK